jgi:hypothetical protein
MKSWLKVIFLICIAPIVLMAMSYGPASRKVKSQYLSLKVKAEISCTKYHLGDTLKMKVKITNALDSSILIPDPNVYKVEFQPQARPIISCLRACNLYTINTRDSLSILPRGKSVVYKGNLPLTENYFTVADTAYNMDFWIRWSPYDDELKPFFVNGKWKGVFSNENETIITHTPIAIIEGLSFFIVK